MTALCIDCEGDGVYPSGARCKSCGGSGAVEDGDGAPWKQPVSELGVGRALAALKRAPTWWNDTERMRHVIRAYLTAHEDPRP